jgi:hypothetical protein
MGLPPQRAINMTRCRVEPWFSLTHNSIFQINPGVRQLLNRNKNIELNGMIFVLSHPERFCQQLV